MPDTTDLRIAPDGRLVLPEAMRDAVRLTGEDSAAGRGVGADAA